jgi:hypothetical protein
MPVESLLPILVYFLVGIALRRSGTASGSEAAFLFRFILHVTLPALVFQAISGATLTRDLILLPVSGLAINLMCMSAAIAYARAASLSTHASGTLVLGAAIMNGVFVFTFVLMSLGPEALAEAILVDLGNAVFVATFAYSAAGYFGGSRRASLAASLFRTFRSPIFIALAIGLVCALGELRPPAMAMRVLSPLGAATIPLTMVALGISFSHVALRDPLAVRTVLLRMPLGLAAGFFFVWLFGFAGATATVVLVAAASPIGFSSVTLASVARLESEQAVAALSLSVAVGMASTPLLLWAAHRWL